MMGYNQFVKNGFQDFKKKKKKRRERDRENDPKMLFSAIKKVKMIKKMSKMKTK